MRALSLLLGSLAFVILLAGRVYQMSWHPEWTETEAMLSLWWVWAGCSLLGGLAGVAALAAR
jgi:hypothetical protein